MTALQSANHEVGTIQHVGAFAAARRRRRCSSTPAPRWAGSRCPRGWAAAAGSAHKWGGPAGVGVLLVRHGAAWENPFPADDRADHRATGLRERAGRARGGGGAPGRRRRAGRRQRRASTLLVDRIRAAAAAIDDVDVVGDPDARLPHLVTFSVLYVNGERLVTELDRRGFGVASGSACTASTLEPSRVLAAMGALTHGNVRVSLTRDTTADDVERFCAVLPEVVAELRA